MPKLCNAGEVWSNTRRKCYNPATRKRNYWDRVQKKKDKRRLNIFPPLQKIAETKIKLNKKDIKTLLRADHILVNIYNRIRINDVR